MAATKYRVMARTGEASLVILGEFEGSSTQALTAAAKLPTIPEGTVSLVAVPVSNWTELAPTIDTVTRVRFGAVAPGQAHIPVTPTVEEDDAA